MSASNVRYPKEMRERAKAGGAHLITIQALGMTMQAPATIEEARLARDLATKIFAGKCRKPEKKKSKAAK